MRTRGLLIACGAAAASALLLPTPPLAHVGGPAWPLMKVMRTIDDARLRVGGRVLRVDASTTLCSGEGRASRVRRVRAWKHFRCTFTTESGFGRDVEFRVHPLGVRRFALTNARWVGP